MSQSNSFPNRTTADLWLNAAAGLAGGLLASFAMNQFQAVVKDFSQMGKSEKEKQAQQSSGNSGEDATVKTAEALTETATGHGIAPENKEAAGAAVHYGYGTLIGGLYGAAAGLLPAVTFGRGTAFGAVAWLGGDEIAVPAFGLSQLPTETPASSHISALAAHLVYGAVVNGVMRLLRR